MTGLARAAFVALLIFGVDQGSKYWVLTSYDLDIVGRVEILPFLNFVYAINTGVNFGLGASDSATQQMILALFAAAVSIGLFVWSSRTNSRYVALGCGLLAGGALANALDRLHAGGVIDFINMDCCGIGNPYAFNVADVAIFAGALLVAWFAWSPQTAAE